MLDFIRQHLRSPKLVCDPSPQHLTSLRYWQACSNTFLTNPEYYDKCETVLRGSILPKLGHISRLLDAGCGNGRFTLLLASAAREVDAYDVSSSLILEASKSAKVAGTNNIRFQVKDICQGGWKASHYDVVSCMGVFSTIIDDWAFRKVALELRNAAHPGGLLLLRDSVSLLPDGQLVESETYATRYRNESYYRGVFSELGLTLEHEELLAEFGSSVNRMYLYRVPKH
jgi:SAM-dependent methyltransferase